MAESRAARTAFKALFFVAPYRLVSPVARRVRWLPYVELVVAGRNSGTERRTMVTLFELDGHWYVGHPNGRSQWVQNMEAARAATIVRRREQVQVTPVLLPNGEERDAVVKATSRQPFPANVVYRTGRSHVGAAGCYFRLEKTDLKTGI